MDMNTPLLLFLSVICANILRAQTIESDDAKPGQGGSAAQAAGATANAGPCQKPAEPVEAVVARPAPKPGAIRAEIALRDGSVLRCAIPARGLPFTTAFGQKVDIRLGSIDKVVARAGEKGVVVHFRNGDRLTGAVGVESFKVRTAFGPLTLPVSVVKTVAFQAGTSNSSGLVYWCTFESKESIAKPAAGPRGAYHAGIFVDGKEGKALKTDGPNLAMAVNLPTGSFGNKGCVEFWARIEEPNRPFPGGGSPTFFMAATAGGYLWLEYNINNGHGMGGLCAVVAARTCGIPMSYSGSPQSYSSVLKDDPGGWHHYALVWNDEGLKDVKTLDGEVATFAVLVDGEKYSSRNFEGKPGSFGKMAEGPVLFCLSMPNPSDYRVVPFSIDELKIWSYDKTTFVNE